MNINLFLQKFNGKSSTNTSEGLNVNIKGKKKFLPLNDVADVISQYDVYNEERENCNKIRLTCQVNTICSNVLFNDISEIVRDEGSDNVSFINYGVGRDGLFQNVVFKPNEMEFWSGSSWSSNNDDTSLQDEDVYSSASTNSIRDTQLSNQNNGFVYHCGIDIFNNHLIRSNTFKTVCSLGDGQVSDTFNTIADHMRDVRGEYVSEHISFPVFSGLDSKDVDLHLYEIDDLLNFNNCVNERLSRKYNGWLGFENRPKIKSYINFRDGEDLSMERPIMYINGGDFVDMYPSRDLYSIVPLYNRYRNRIERNWNYCLTYPSSSYTPSDIGDPFSEIIESSNGINSMRAVYFDEGIRNTNGTSNIVIYSVAKHGLSVGDYVNVYKTYETELFWVASNGERISDEFVLQSQAEAYLSKLSANTNTCGDSSIGNLSIESSDTNVYSEVALEDAEVVDVVNDYIFSVFGGDRQISDQWIYIGDAETSGITLDDGRTLIMDDTRRFMRDGDERIYYVINNSYVNADLKSQRISYKKVSNGIECDYYIRIFSRLPNFKFASGDTSSEYEIYRRRDDNKEDTLVSIYQGHEFEFESHISKLAFAKNIYSDDIGEIVFTDDINLAHLHDNLGRPLTEIYLTFVKNNRGYKEWYGYDYVNENWETDDIRSNGVEFSHAFGIVTCGIETSFQSTYGEMINSINRISNVGGNPVGFQIGGIINDEEREYESNGKRIRIRQEEVSYEQDNHFYGDLCYYDSYNANEVHIDYINHRFNTAQRESSISASRDFFEHYNYDEITIDDYDNTTYTVTSFSNDYNCNEKSEGYYYNPHHRIQIKSFGELDSTMPDFLEIRQIHRVRHNVYRFTTLEQHFLSKGDNAILYDQVSRRYYNLLTIENDGYTYRTFTCIVSDLNQNNYVDIMYRDTDDFIINLSSSVREVSDGQEHNTLGLYNFKLFKMDNIDCPSYAKILDDGTCRIIWRDVVKNIDYPYTNDAFYINERVDLYVRRQDPEGIYRLYHESDVDGNIMDVKQEDNYTKEIDIEC